MSTSVSPDAFFYHGLRYSGLPESRIKKSTVNDRRFKAKFGATPYICSFLWDMIYMSLGNGARFIHLLWGLLFMKVYATETVHCGMVGVDEKTFRKWAWKVVETLASLKPQIIYLENRFIGDNGSACLLSIDAADFRIPQQDPFWTGWYTHKFNGPGLRYELGLCIQTGDICWTNGPFAPGIWPDVNIFRNDLKKKLLRGERVEADDGYRDPVCDGPTDMCLKKGQKKAKALVRSRHETVNKRMKQFNCLKQVFRHDIKKHGIVFDAVAVITQMNIKYGGEPLFPVKYHTCN